MPIRVKCVCQQQFDAPDNLAGKTVKCPKCASPITIPMAASKPVAAARPAPVAPNAMASLLDEAGVKQRSAVGGCPACGAPFPPEAVLCVECGYNFRTGRKLETKFVATSAMDNPIGHGVNAEFLLEKALRDQEAEKLLQKKMVSFGLPWWGYGLILIAIIAFIIGMGSLPQDQAMLIAGWILVIAGSLLSTAGAIWMRVAAFKLGFVWFLVVFLLTPLGEFIFAFVNWDEGAAPFALWFGGGIVILLGCFAWWLSTMLGKSDDQAMLMNLVQMAIPV